MTDSDTKPQALAYIAQALNDYAQTLAPSVRGPFVREMQEAIKAIEHPAATAPCSSSTPA